MKILIVEDIRYVAESMSNALKDLGYADVTVCTKSDDVREQMPSKDNVLALVSASDVVFLDDILGCNEYTGTKLLPHCAGKKVIGISGSRDFPGCPSYQKEKREIYTPSGTEAFKAFITKVLAR